MDSNQFRVGNYIVNGLKLSYGSIEYIERVSALFSARDKYLINSCHPNTYPCLGSVCEFPMGLSISTERLYKLGFGNGYDKSSYTILIEKRSEEPFYDNYFTIGYNQNENNWSIYNDTNTAHCHLIAKVDYIHEVQNIIFVLTKTELTFKE